ncbi:MAG: hypothetical protein KKE24_08910 [Candidatus Thermoplasmatota archaeon]|nr:hypothetical protein [Candidatus Thermoplasmatota archaeon]
MRAFAVALALAFCVVSIPVTALDLDRSNSDYWTYDMSMIMDGIEVIGSLTLTVVDEDTLTIGSDTYAVDVIQYSGGISGSGVIDGMNTSMSVVYSGFTYELKDGLATVKDDIYSWITTSQSELAHRTETHYVTTSSPPIGSRLVPGVMSPGDSWSEIVFETTTSTEWVEGMLTDTSTDADEITYSFSIASTEESLATDAGTFHCLKITVTDESDESYEIRWYCYEMGYYVKVADYESGGSVPSVVLELKECKYDASSKVLITMLVVVGAVALAAVVTTIILLTRKNRIPQQPQEPKSTEPPTPPVV